MHVPPCNLCGRSLAFVARWHTASDGSKHIKATCAGCGRYLKWLPNDYGGDVLPEEKQAAKAEARQGELFPGHSDGLDKRGGY